MLKRSLFFFFLFVTIFLFGQKKSRLLDSIISAHPVLKEIVTQKERYRPQIIYTQINRDANNKPNFINHTYLVDSNSYFYPASLVKLPVSIFALEKLNALQIKGLTKSTNMLTDSDAVCQKKVWVDSAALNGYPSIEQHIKKMFLVSDNSGFNRVFEFDNPKFIQARLSAIGLPRARIVHRLDFGCVGTGNRHFNPIRFVGPNEELIYHQPSDSLNEDFNMPLGKILIGRNIYNKRKKLISERKDFAKSNYLPLQTVHSILQRLVFNEYMDTKAFNLTKPDWEFLMKYLGMYPRESDFPLYDAKLYYDSFKKYFIYGSTVKTIESDSIRIFNIVGRAYGFLIDCAYIVDFNKKVEFMLSSVIYVNKRNSFGSGNYEYDAVGLPFLKELSLALHDFEIKRNRRYLPDLSAFNFYKKN